MLSFAEFSLNLWLIVRIRMWKRNQNCNNRLIDPDPGGQSITDPPVPDPQHSYLVWIVKSSWSNTCFMNPVLFTFYKLFNYSWNFAGEPRRHLHSPQIRSLLPLFSIQGWSSFLNLLQSSRLSSSLQASPLIFKPLLQSSSLSSNL